MSHATKTHLLTTFVLIHCSCGPSSSGEMVSRRKILSRSRDDLHMEGPVANEQDEEDVWYNKEKLYKVGLIEVWLWICHSPLPRELCI